VETHRVLEVLEGGEELLVLLLEADHPATLLNVRDQILDEGGRR